MLNLCNMEQLHILHNKTNLHSCTYTTMQRAATFMVNWHGSLFISGMQIADESQLLAFYFIDVHYVCKIHSHITYHHQASPSMAFSGFQMPYDQQNLLKTL